MPDTIAFLGLGTMGAGMAASLLRAGFPLAVYNRTRAAAEPLAAQGARVAATPAEAAHGARLIVAMVADDAASRAVWTGETGALAAASPGAVLVECSTLSPVWIAELAALAARCSLELLDAPVTGSRAQAESGQLTFLVGGAPAALAAARSALAAMGKAIVHLGPTGSGARMKLVNNFLCGVQIASLAEAIAWLERSHMDVGQALGLLAAGAPGSPLLAGVSKRMTAPDAGLNFRVRLMEKDLQYAEDEARRCGLVLTTAEPARARFHTATAAGLGDQDIAAVVRPLRQD